VGYFNSIDIAASALTAQRLRMDIISQNIANSETTRTEDGTAYRRRIVVFREKENTKPFSQYLAESSEKITSGGVEVSSIIEDQTPFKRVYDPGHPDADEAGYVEMPNVDIVTEMVNMISASRAYEASITSLNTSKSMALKALDIVK